MVGLNMASCAETRSRDVCLCGGEYSLVDLGDIEGHFDDLGLVVLLDFLEEASVSRDDEVDGDTFLTESA